MVLWFGKKSTSPNYAVKITNQPTKKTNKQTKEQKTVETTKAHELRAVTEKKQRFTPGNYKANDPKTTQTFFM